MKQQKNGRQNYDWDHIKLDYISNPSLSLKKIAEKYKIRLHTVEKRSTADGWYEEKMRYQKSLADDATQRVYAAQTEILERELQAADALCDALCKAISDPKQFNRHIVYQNGQQVEMIFDVCNFKAMLDAVKALKMLVDIKMSLLGITRIEHQERMQLAREKLQLERERLEWEKKKSEYGNTDGEKHQIGIVILPEVKNENAEDAAERAAILKSWSQ